MKIPKPNSEEIHPSGHFFPRHIYELPGKNELAIQFKTILIEMLLDLVAPSG